MPSPLAENPNAEVAAASGYRSDFVPPGPKKLGNCTRNFPVTSENYPQLCDKMKMPLTEALSLSNYSEMMTGSWKWHLQSIDLPRRGGSALRGRGWGVQRTDGEETGGKQQNAGSPGLFSAVHKTHFFLLHIFPTEVASLVELNLFSIP